MEKSKTHWKKNYNYDYLGSYSLPGGNEVTLTMASTRKEFITGTSGKKEEAFVCRFKETHDWVKPMILNKTKLKKQDYVTNQRRILKLANYGIYIALSCYINLL